MIEIINDVMVNFNTNNFEKLALKYYNTLTTPSLKAQKLQVIKLQ